MSGHKQAEPRGREGGGGGGVRVGRGGEGGGLGCIFGQRVGEDCARPRHLRASWFLPGSGSRGFDGNGR